MTGVQGISLTERRKKRTLYKRIYALYSTSDKTMQQIGEEHGMTKQRISQIVLRSIVGGGDYYSGSALAKNAYSELEQEFKGIELAQEFHKWLSMRGIKTAKNNKAFTLYLGKNNAKRK